MKKDKKGPEFIRFFIPLITILRELGGSGTALEIVEKTVELSEIPLDEQKVLNKNGYSRIHNQVYWAKFYLSKARFIESSTRRIWTLTNKGKTSDLTNLKPLDIFEEVHSKFKVETRKSISTAEIAEDIDSFDYKTRLLDIIKSLPSAGFEHLCQRLLRESGFEQVIVTGRTGDGGIDGNGILQLNPFVSFKILFQCKRYSGSVSSGAIRDFRGAIQGKADKGIFITSGIFTSDARKEAHRDGAIPIELVDGNKLIEMFENLELGLTPKKTYEINEAFFDEYKI